MQLIILRHGDAQPYAPNDNLRELSTYGRAQIEWVGEYLMQLPLRPGLIAYSPLVRATQTAQAVLDCLAPVAFEVWPELVHSASAAPVELKLAACKADSVLLVSHMPLVASLTGYLCDGGGAVAPFQTGELAMLSTQECYPGAWRLDKRIVPPL